jgi:hypothetical protein
VFLAYDAIQSLIPLVSGLITPLKSSMSPSCFKGAYTIDYAPKENIEIFYFRKKKNHILNYIYISNAKR